MQTTPVAHRTRRAEEARAARREEILAAARLVFSRRGFRGTTIADIAEEAGIALGTIYLYFASKDDVFAALNAQLHDLIVAALNDVRPTPSLDESVRLRIHNVFDACSRNRDLVRLVVINTDADSAVTKRMRQSAEQRNGPMALFLGRAMKAGVVRSGDPDIMARLTQGLVSIAVYQAFVLSDGADAAAYRDMCSDMLVAFMTPKR